MAGVNVGGEVSLSKLYPTIVTSEAVLKNVIYQRYRTISFPDSANLQRIWEIDDKDAQLAYEKLLRSLRDELEVSLDNKTSVLTISLLTREPQLSAAIVNDVAAHYGVFEGNTLLGKIDGWQNILSNKISALF